MTDTRCYLSQSLDNLNMSGSRKSIQDGATINTKGSLLNERIQKIKHKYGTNNDLKQSFLDYQSTLYQSIIQDKQNCSEFLNQSYEKNQLLTNKLKLKNYKRTQKQHVKQQKQKKIKQLQQINMKISNLIENIKKEGDEFQKQQILIPKLKILNKSKKNFSYLHFNDNAISKISTLQSKRANSKRSESVNKCIDCQKKHNRVNGKILIKKTPFMESMKQIRTYDILSEQVDETKRLINYFCKQIQYDETFMKYKTQAIKMGKKCRDFIINALKKSEISEEQQSLILDWNFQQMDPLFTERQNKRVQDINLLVFQVIDSFLKSQNYWRRKILNKFNIKNISLKDLDIQGKGYFLKQDFARFLSIKSGFMYCNRQVSLILKRIHGNKGKIISIKSLTNIICN